MFLHFNRIISAFYRLVWLPLFQHFYEFSCCDASLQFALYSFLFRLRQELQHKRPQQENCKGSESCWRAQVNACDSARERWSKLCQGLQHWYFIPLLAQRCASKTRQKAIEERDFKRLQLEFCKYRIRWEARLFQVSNFCLSKETRIDMWDAFCTFHQSFWKVYCCWLQRHWCHSSTWLVQSPAQSRGKCPEKTHFLHQRVALCRPTGKVSKNFHESQNFEKRSNTESMLNQNDGKQRDRNLTAATVVAELDNQASELAVKLKNRFNLIKSYTRDNDRYRGATTKTFHK